MAANTPLVDADAAALSPSQIQQRVDSFPQEEGAMSRKSEQIKSAKFDALRACLENATGTPNADSLARSYGLTPVEVQRVIEELSENAKFNQTV